MDGSSVCQNSLSVWSAFSQCSVDSSLSRSGGSGSRAPVGLSFFLDEVFFLKTEFPKKY